MVQLLIGHKGSGKTRKMCDIANEMLGNANGSIVFISKSNRLNFDLNYKIRVVSMEEFPHITNCDEYIGFMYGILSSDHDLETVFIDSILKHADITLESIPEFIGKLKVISEESKLNFVVSLSAERAELADVDFDGCEVIEMA